MISVQADNVQDGKALEQEVDAEIRVFDEWFQRKNNAPLTGVERAIIKTYLWMKTHPEAGAKKEEGSEPPSLSSSLR